MTDPTTLPTPQPLSPPLPAALPETPRRTSTRSAVAVGREVRYGTVLRPWMRAYAEWTMLDADPTLPVQARLARARGLSRLPLSKSALAALEAREDFQAYCDELRAGPVEAARAQFAARFPEYVAAHFDALTSARAENDYRAVAQITEPVLDRVYPKKGEAPTVATQVNIVLTPEQASAFTTAYEAPVMEVEAPAPQAP